MKQVSNAEFESAYANKDNLNLINSILKGYHGKLDEDELVACGMRALWRCLAYHNPNAPSRLDQSIRCSQKFTSSLWRHLHWEIRKELEKRRRSREKLPLFLDLFQHDKNVDMDQIEEVKNNNKKVLELRECIASLPIDEKQLIQQRFYDRLTYQEIGNNNGYSGEAARSKVNSAILSLKRLAMAA